MYLHLTDYDTDCLCWVLVPKQCTMNNKVILNFNSSGSLSRNHLNSLDQTSDSIPGFF